MSKLKLEMLYQVEEDGDNVFSVVEADTIEQLAEVAALTIKNPKDKIGPFIMDNGELVEFREWRKTHNV